MNVNAYFNIREIEKQQRMRRNELDIILKVSFCENKMSKNLYEFWDRKYHCLYE